MTRVLSVVDRSIMVSVFDVRPNDIIHVSGDERDPIVERVEHNDKGQVRFHYKQSPQRRMSRNIDTTLWMPAVPGQMDKVFIHDLMNERVEFNVTTRS